jgi:DNA topoisomerase-1
LKPNEGTKEDPAHPSVYPTWEIPKRKLSGPQKKLYDLIVRRFLAVFSDEALRESMNVSIDVAGNEFVVVGRRTIEPGWTKIYEPYLAFEEQLLPELKEGQGIKVIKIDMLAKETQPPGRFSQGSIVKEMEERNIGTRATRAEILQTLYDRGYVLGQSIQVTKLGETVTLVLKEFCPRILSENLTRHFEEEMELVLQNKKKRDEVVEEAEKVLTKILKDFKKNESKIGKKLLKGFVEARKTARTLGKCPNCGSDLKIIYSRRTRKRFVGCSGYPKCKTGFPLPQFGNITSLNKECPECKLPMIQVWRPGKRPFRMCINHKCKTKADWGKKKPAAKAEENKAEEKPAEEKK